VLEKSSSQENGRNGRAAGFVRMTFTKSDPACVEAARALYNSGDVSGVLERQKGHRFHHLLESADVPGEGVSVTAWDSREDAEAYEQSGAYEDLVARFRHFYTGPARLGSYEVRE
jgi:heme-degrading monooxygenase HmoA